MDIVKMQKYIFGSIFLSANRLQVLGDQYLAVDGITTKQWFLHVIISQFGENAPTLSEVADLAGNSRQNVKQLALKLEEKGFLIIQKDAQDARVLRLKLTDKSLDFWKRRRDQDNEYVARLFEDLSEEETRNMFEGFKKLEKKIQKMDRNINKGV